MTFKEFFNKSDNTPLLNTINVPKMTGVSVVKDYQKSNPKKFFTPPKQNNGHKPVMPSMLMLPYRKPISQRPIESKPTDFLSRKSSISK